MRINPSCIRMVKSLQLFNQDIKNCKFLISIAPGAPSCIPPAQWEKIFQGEPIDLNQILSALHQISITEERKACIGNSDILLGPPEVTRKVATSSDWSAAWWWAARATSFVFPHRAHELEDYTEYIENEFAAKVPSGHHRVILFNIAVRNLVQGGQQMLLTNTNKFGSLYLAIVMPDGIQYAGGSQKPQAAKGKAEICNRFNDKGCNSASCHYKHSCKTCGSSEHGKTACRSATKS